MNWVLMTCLFPGIFLSGWYIGIQLIQISNRQGTLRIKQDTTTHEEEAFTTINFTYTWQITSLLPRNFHQLILSWTLAATLVTINTHYIGY